MSDYPVCTPLTQPSVLEMPETPTSDLNEFVFSLCDSRRLPGSDVGSKRRGRFDKLFISKFSANFEIFIRKVCGR